MERDSTALSWTLLRIQLETLLLGLCFSVHLLQGIHAVAGGGAALRPVRQLKHSSLTARLTAAQQLAATAPQLVRHDHLMFMHVATI